MDIKVGSQMLLSIEEFEVDSIDGIARAVGEFCRAELFFIGVNLVKSPMALLAAGEEEKGQKQGENCKTARGAKYAPWALNLHLLQFCNFFEQFFQMVIF
jgi:hypothetical protein